MKNIALQMGDISKTHLLMINQIPTLTLVSTKV